MGSSADVTLLLAFAACVVGVGVALAMWRRQVRWSRANRRTHPSMQAPLSLTVVRIDPDDAVDPGGAEGGGGGAPRDARRWCVSVRPDGTPVSIDIVTFRAAAPHQPWHSEPIVEPVRIEPGGSTVLLSEFPPAPSYDAVVGWTVHQPTGDVQGARTFRVLDTPAGATVGAPVGTARGRPHLDLLVVGLLVTGVALTTWGVLARSDGERTSGAPVTLATMPIETPLPTTATTSPPTTPTTPPATTPTTTPATTTDAPTTTTTPVTSVVEGSRVLITATIGDCRFGTDCLIAGFTIAGFETAPSQYVCEFADGSRIEFGFGGDGVDTACATGSADAAITIDVEGVRSETVTRASVDDG